MFVLSPINNGAVLFQNMTRSFSRNNLAEQSQQHFMALDNFMLLRVFLEHSRTAETSAQKCSKPDNFNLKMSKIGNGEERHRSSPLPKRASKTWQNIVICLVKMTQPTGELELCKQTKLSLATVWT